MKFLCPNCKAKYQIADEKVSGRTLKMTCRQCNEEIVIRGDGSRRPGADSRAPSSSPGIGMAADFQRRVAQGPVSVTPPAGADQWHVAINDIPVGPMRREEVARKINMGAVGPESLAWREGLDDWLPIKHIPELMALCRAALSVSLPPPPPAMASGKFQAAERAPMSPLGGRVAAPSTDMFEEAPVPPPAPPPAPAPAPPPPAPPPPAAPAPPEGSYAGPAPTSHRDDSSKGTLGWAPMFLLVCGGAFILAVGAVLGARVLAPSPQAAAPAAPAQPAETPAPVQAEPVIPEPEPEPIVLEPQEIAGDVEEEAVASKSSGSTKSSTKKPSTSSSSKSNLTAEEQEKLARMRGEPSTSLNNLKRPTTSSGSNSSASADGLNASQLSAVVNKGKRSLQRCYETALRGSGATDTVRMDVKVTVSPAGNVSRVSTSGNGLPGMDTCINRTVKTWRFPSSGGTSQMQFPLVFQPGA